MPKIAADPLDAQNGTRVPDNRKALPATPGLLAPGSALERSRLLSGDQVLLGDFPGRVRVPRVTGGEKSSRIDGKKVPPKPPRRLDMEDIPRRFSETQRQALTRLRTIIGTRLSDHPLLKRVWEQARANVLKRYRLTKSNCVKLYDSVRTSFWQRVRKDPAASRLLNEVGFELKGNAATAPKLAGVAEDVPVGEITVSLDHINEKARFDNWKKALDPENLRLEFSRPNTARENLQRRHPETRPEEPSGQPVARRAARRASPVANRPPKTTAGKAPKAHAAVAAHVKRSAAAASTRTSSSVMPSSTELGRAGPSSGSPSAPIGAVPTPIPSLAKSEAAPATTPPELAAVKPVTPPLSGSSTEPSSVPPQDPQPKPTSEGGEPHEPIAAKAPELPASEPVRTEGPVPVKPAGAGSGVLGRLGRIAGKLIPALQVYLAYKDSKEGGEINVGKLIDNILGIVTGIQVIDIKILMPHSSDTVAETSPSRGEGKEQMAESERRPSAMLG